MTLLEDILCDERLDLYLQLRSNCKAGTYSEQKVKLIDNVCKEWELEYDSMIQGIQTAIDNQEIVGSIVKGRYYPQLNHHGQSNTEIYADFLLSNLSNQKPSKLNKLFQIINYPIYSGFIAGAKISDELHKKSETESKPNWHEHLPVIGAASFGLGTVGLLTLVDPLFGVGYLVSSLVARKAYQNDSQKRNEQVLSSNSLEMKYIKKLELEFYRPFEEELTKLI